MREEDPLTHDISGQAGTLAGTGRNFWAGVA